MSNHLWIKRTAATAAALCMATTLFACKSDVPSEDETNASVTQSTVPTASTTANGTTTTAKKTTTTKKATTTTKKATTTTVNNTTITTQATTVATTQAPTTQATTQAPVTNPQGNEILGAGSKNEPYMEHPSEDMSVQTVNVPAGKSLFYNIYRVGGMVLTINSSNVYVVCDGVRYDANGGSLSFEVPAALASDAVSFEIGNTGSSATSFTLWFTNTTGSYMNPVSVSNIAGDKSVSLSEGADTGYYYRYYAEKSGKLRLYMSASTDSVMLATNNRNSAQRTSEADAQTDANGKTYIELEVEAGDEIVIQVGAKPNKRGKYPAVDITWNGKYA